jgi:hypothetical protein
MPHMIYKYREPWWNDIDRKKPKISENLSQSHFVHKYHMDWPRHKPRALS